ncbi:MAG: EamA family transporter [Anaerolineales bacterium]
MNNLILPQAAILSWLFLDEKISLKQILGILFVMLGTLVVQLRRRKL